MRLGLGGLGADGNGACGAAGEGLGETREFLEAIRDDKPVTIPGEDGLRAVAMACAAYESAEKGEAVRIR